MKKVLHVLKIIVYAVVNFVKIVILLIVIAFTLIASIQWSEEQSKVSNQYNSEGVSEDVLYDVKVKMSEKHNIPVDKIRIVREKAAFGFGYEYFVIEVDEEDKEIESYPIEDYEIQTEIDDAIDTPGDAISEEYLKEKYGIEEDELEK